MRKLFFLFISIMLICCSSDISEKENKIYKVEIYYYPRPREEFKNGILVYNNDDELYFSRKITEGILSAKKKYIINNEKDYIFEGFFKIYLISGSDKLEFIVDNTEYVFDVQKDYCLRYNAALDIFRYFGSKYLQELMEKSSPSKL